MVTGWLCKFQMNKMDAVFVFVWVGWNACKQGKVSDCGQRGDHQDDPCLAIFKSTRSFLVASPG